MEKEDYILLFSAVFCAIAFFIIGNYPVGFIAAGLAVLILFLLIFLNKEGEESIAGSH